jgi:integrase
VPSGSSATSARIFCGLWMSCGGPKLPRPVQSRAPVEPAPLPAPKRRQYARLVERWVASVGPDPRRFATHSMRRTKATLIYRRTGNLRAVQLLLGHTRIDYVPRPTMSRKAVRWSIIDTNACTAGT